MVWNPFALVWYGRLEAEQERASDEYAAWLLGDAAAVASGLVEVAAYARELPVLSIGPLAAWGAGGTQRTLEGRVSHLESCLVRPSKAGWLAVLVYPALAAFLAIQPHVALCFPRVLSLLRLGS